MLTKNQKFCSRNCAATHNNKNRNQTTRSKIKDTWAKKRQVKELIPTPLRKTRKRICASCGRIDETTIGHFQSKFCIFCSNSMAYRESCKFTFNIKQYPEEFNLSLLTKFGMFNPKTNRHGVSRDHMLSVNYGKTNRVDPKIMSHPANCQLMLQSENKAKQHHSSITLNELLQRIKEWDAKYNDAGRGNDPRSVRLMRPSGSPDLPA